MDEHLKLQKTLLFQYIMVLFPCVELLCLLSMSAIPGKLLSSGSIVDAAGGEQPPPRVCRCHGSAWLDTDAGGESRPAARL